MFHVVIDQDQSVRRACRAPRPLVLIGAKELRKQTPIVGRLNIRGARRQKQYVAYVRVGGEGPEPVLEHFELGLGGVDETVGRPDALTGGRAELDLVAGQPGPAGGRADMAVGQGTPRWNSSAWMPCTHCRRWPVKLWYSPARFISLFRYRQFRQSVPAGGPRSLYLWLGQPGAWARQFWVTEPETPTATVCVGGNASPSVVPGRSWRTMNRAYSTQRATKARSSTHHGKGGSQG
jgi:hypothetical protein